MKNVCIICGIEFESTRSAKLCSEECKKARKAQYRAGIASKVTEPEVVAEVVKEEPKVKEPKVKAEKKVNPNNMWILTVKDKASKTFKNIIFPTPDVKVAHAFIDDMRKAKVLSFVSLADTDRIEEYLQTGVASKTFQGNINACLARKVPVEPIEMFKSMLEETKKLTGMEVTVEIELIAPTATEVA